MIAPRPWYLRFAVYLGLVAPHTWMTLGSRVHPPDAYWESPGSPLWPPIIAHEFIHVARQAEMGALRWLWKWCTNREFRLKEECLGIAAEVLSHPDSAGRNAVISSYAAALAGTPYFHAAACPAEARLEILRAVDQAMGAC